MERYSAKKALKATYRPSIKASGLPKAFRLLFVDLRGPQMCPHAVGEAPRGNKAPRTGGALPHRILDSRITWASRFSFLALLLLALFGRRPIAAAQPRVCHGPFRAARRPAKVTCVVVAALPERQVTDLPVERSVNEHGRANGNVEDEPQVLVAHQFLVVQRKMAVKYQRGTVLAKGIMDVSS